MRFLFAAAAVIFFLHPCFLFAGMLDTARLAETTAEAGIAPAGGVGRFAAERSSAAAVKEPAGERAHGHDRDGKCCALKLVKCNLVIVYGKTDGKDHEAVKSVVRDSAIFETLVEHLNSFIELPSELKLRLAMLGEENAYYDPEKKEIIISYELLKYFSDLVDLQKDMNAAGKAELFVDLVFFVTLHELGHALIDIFDLPITGKEEDVADQIASWIMLKTFGDDDHRAVLSLVNASEWFVAEFDASAVKVEDLEFAGSHSLDPQRFYNIIAWSYGFNPDAAVAALGADIGEFLTDERIESAAVEFDRIDRSFAVLLKKYLK